MAYFFLLINGVLYGLLAVWCVLAPKKTASQVGFDFNGGSGESEYLVVYGGLQLALAFFFFITAFSPTLQRSGIIFSMILYLSLASFRVLSFLLYSGISKTTYYLSSIEISFAIISIGLYLRSGNSN